MLLERARELALVAGMLGDARDSRGGVVIVAGPLGIGRSALLGALRDRTDPAEALVLHAGGARLEQEFPYGVANQLLDHLPAAARPPLPGSPKTSPRETRGEEDRLSDAVFEAAAGRPVLVLVDDLHWVDSPSLRWLAQLAETAADRPLVLVAAGRRDTRPASSRVFASAAHETVLRPLTGDAVGELVSARFGESGDAAFRRECTTVSRGRPLFIAALLRELHEAGEKPRASAKDALRVARPAVIGARARLALAAHTASEKDVAAALAVLGEPADAELLTRTAGVDRAECEAALATLATTGLVEESGALPWFSHDSIADALEHAMPAPEAAERHLRIAEALNNAGRPAARIAPHLLAAGGPSTGWAVGVLRAAGHSALESGDQAAARRCLRHALLGVLASTERAELLAELAAVERSSDPVSALRHLAQALPRLTPVGRRGRELAALPTMAFELCPQSLIRHLTEAGPDVGVEARLRYARLTDLTHFTDSVETFRHLDPRTPLRTAPHRDRTAVLVHAATLAGSRAGVVAALARRVVLAEPPSAADLRTGVPLAARALLAVDQLNQADSWLASVTALARKEGGDDAAETLIGEAERAYCLARRGWHSEATTLAARILDRADPAFTPVAGRCCEALALVVADAVAPDQARRALAAHRARESAMIPGWLGNLVDGVLAASVGDTAVAVEHLLDCGREYDLMGWVNPAVLPWRGWAARLQHRLGQPELALELIREEHDLAAAWGTPTALGRTLRGWAGLVDGAESIDLARRAIDVLEGSYGLLELAKAYILLGRRLLPVDRTEAAQHLARGDRLAKSCGVLDEQVPAEAPDRATLTPAERRIGRLALAGQANQQIAADLEISVRAVEKHLTRVYRKLGITGRAELPTVAHTLDAPGLASA